MVSSGGDKKKAGRFWGGGTRTTEESTCCFHGRLVAGEMVGSFRKGLLLLAEMANSCESLLQSEGAGERQRRQGEAWSKLCLHGHGVRSTSSAAPVRESL